MSTIGQSPAHEHAPVGRQQPRKPLGGPDRRGIPGPEEREHLASGIGAELRKRRIALDLSQEKLGELVGIGRRHVSDLERGQRRPSVDALIALARVLAPVEAREEALDWLQALAGDSLRITAPRQRRKPQNKHRRQALEALRQQVEHARREVARRDGIGIPCPEYLRKLAQGEALENAERLEALASTERTSASQPLTRGNAAREHRVSTTSHGREGAR